MKLRVVPGEDGEWTRRETLAADALELASDPLFDEIEILAQFRQRDRAIDIRLTAQATVKTDCYRCGALFSFRIEPSLALRCVRVTDPYRDSGDDDLKLIGLHQNEIDLTQDVRDMLTLALPMRIVCCEPPEHE